MDAHETTIFTAVLIASVAFGIVLLALVLLLVRRRQRDAARQRQQLTEEIALLEKERIRIATDLHDELVPILSLTMMQVQSVAGKCGDESAVLQKACLQIDTVIQRLGGIARNLAPRVLLEKGVFSALEDFFELCRQTYPIYFDYRFTVKGRLGASQGLHVYRMIQEIVYNAVKYAEASYISVVVVEKQNRLIIVCKDNGKGFAAKRREGLGMESIRNRIGILGGTMKVASNIGCGTEYFFEISYTHHER